MLLHLYDSVWIDIDDLGRAGVGDMVGNIVTVKVGVSM